MSAFQKTTLKNGIRVVSEDMPSSRALSCGIWIEAGTRDESKNKVGVSHFLEHITFKGTKKRTSYQLVRDLEEVGGELNAFTTREYTCYHSLGLHDSLELSIDVLSDLVKNATMPKREIDIEKNVVLQEILATQDDTEELIYDHFFELYFKGSALGFPILGTEKSIKALTKKVIMDYYKSMYTPGRIVVAASGRLEHDKLVSAVEKSLGRLSSRSKKLKRKTPKTHSFYEYREANAEQVHILMGLPSTSFKSKRRFEAFIVNSLLGGGMTSKLYQRVRETEGLVYTISSSLNTFTDVGLMNIYASTSPKNLKRVIQLIVKELKNLKKIGVSESDLRLFKNQVKAGVLLGADDVENRMNSIAINELVFGRYKPVDEVVHEIEAVSIDSLREYVEQDYPLHKLSTLMMGPGDQAKNLSWLDDIYSGIS